MPNDLTQKAEQLLARAGLDQSTSVEASPVAPRAVQESEARQLAIIADLDNGDQTLTAIARKHGVNVSTVSRLAAKLDTLTEAARKYLSSKAFIAADHFIQASAVAASKGDHRPAKDLLLHSGVIEPVADSNTRASTQIAIVIGEPGRPVRVSPADADS